MTTESIIIDSGDYGFTYNPKRSYDQNFNEWRVVNSEERSAWGEKQLTMEEAEATFSRMYGNRK
tara:strand:- start:1993 stop:2184 length:192 start_codon:yes stop_codon:yes gene_type:complete